MSKLKNKLKKIKQRTKKKIQDERKKYRMKEINTVDR